MDMWLRQLYLRVQQPNNDLSTALMFHNRHEVKNTIKHPSLLYPTLTHGGFKQ